MDSFKNLMKTASILPSNIFVHTVPYFYIQFQEGYKFINFLKAFLIGLDKFQVKYPGPKVNLSPGK